MKYYTVKDIADLVGEHNIVKVESQGKFVAITTRGGLYDRKCNYCKGGSHTSPSADIRVKIRVF